MFHKTPKVTQFRTKLDFQAHAFALLGTLPFRLLSFFLLNYYSTSTLGFIFWQRKTSSYMYVCMYKERCIIVYIRFLSVRIISNSRFRLISLKKLYIGSLILFFIYFCIKIKTLSVSVWIRFHFATGSIVSFEIC